MIMVMTMIKKVSLSTIDKDFLKGFKRIQHTNNVLYNENGTLIEKEIVFDDDWPEVKLEEISLYLKDCIKKGGSVYAAYSGKHVIGFTCIEHYYFDDYVNMAYLHVDQRYRGEGIGKELIYFIAMEAKSRGVKKLYISAHPSIETMSFYFSVGCKQAEKINEELLAVEPYDIQLELECSSEVLLKLVKLYIKKHKKSATYYGKLASRFYRFLPKDRNDFFEVVRMFLEDDTIGCYSIGTLWLKRRNDLLVAENIDYFDDLLHTVVHGWGKVDQICYRAINPVIESGELYEYLLKWSDSDNKDVRRASLVAMIQSSTKQALTYDYDKMIYLVEKLKHDEDFHVRKAVGWTLKCAYPTYKKKVECYLRENVGNLDRMIYRYALEHVEEPLRTELINLR